MNFLNQAKPICLSGLDRKSHISTLFLLLLPIVAFMYAGCGPWGRKWLSGVDGPFSFSARIDEAHRAITQRIFVAGVSPSGCTVNAAILTGACILPVRSEHQFQRHL
jgi:hypothetical protein